MCNAYCCCRGYGNGSLINLLFIFTSINLLLSIVAIFIKAAKTGRYKEALIYLEERNNGTFNNFKFENCTLGGLFKLTYYCDIYGQRLSKPEKNVEFQSIYKNWGKIEITLNVSRLVITGIYSIFLYFAIKKRGNAPSLMSDEQIRMYIILMNYLIGFLSFLIFVSGLCIMIRAFSITANNDIGLYEDGDQNSFEERIAINYIIDITQIVLNSIEICFAIRLRKIIFVVIVEPPPPPPPTVVPPTVGPVPKSPSGAVVIINQQINLNQETNIHQKNNLSVEEPLNNFN